MRRLLFCCLCHQRIAHPTDGNLIWPAHDNGQPVPAERYYFVHKFCDNTWQHQHPEFWWKWRDLTEVRLNSEQHILQLIGGR